MLFDFINVKAVIADKEFFEKASGVERNVFGILDLYIHNGLEEFFPVAVVERRAAGEHFEDDDAETPPVDFLAIRESFQDFRGKVLRCAAEGVGLVAATNVVFSEAEVCQFNVPIRVNDDIFGLETER